MDCGKIVMSPSGMLISDDSAHARALSAYHAWNSTCFIIVLFALSMCCAALYEAQVVTLSCRTGSRRRTSLLPDQAYLCEAMRSIRACLLNVVVGSLWLVKLQKEYTFLSRCLLMRRDCDDTTRPIYPDSRAARPVVVRHNPAADGKRLSCRRPQPTQGHEGPRVPTTPKEKGAELRQARKTAQGGGVSENHGSCAQRFPCRCGSGSLTTNRQRLIREC